MTRLRPAEQFRPFQDSLSADTAALEPIFCHKFLKLLLAVGKITANVIAQPDK